MNKELEMKIKQYLTDYTHLEKEIRDYKIELKKKTERRKELTRELVLIMENTNIDCFELGKNSVLHKKQKMRQNLSKKYLKTVLTEHIKDDNYVDTIINTIMDNRETKEVDTLVYRDLSS